MIDSCKSTFFMDAYIEKIKKSIIKENIKRPIDNPLDLLLQVDKEFEKQKKESKIVKEFIDYCFSILTDMVTENEVMKELIKNP
jgi:DNA-binding transcriptional regulator GbsR (MarR family)